MKQICYKCGSKLGTKQPSEGHTAWAGYCDNCHKKGYVTAPRDFGIYDKPSEDVKKLMDLFKIKQ